MKNANAEDPMPSSESLLTNLSTQPYYYIPDVLCHPAPVVGKNKTCVSITPTHDGNNHEEAALHTIIRSRYILVSHIRCARHRRVERSLGWASYLAQFTTLRNLALNELSDGFNHDPKLFGRSDGCL